MSPLSGVTVVVTRPAHQAENLCHLIEAEGGTALRFPVIEIGPPQDQQKCQVQLSQLAEADLAIFVSSNAVVAACSLQKTLQQNWPNNVAIAAVGKATAQTLEENHFQTTHVAPEPFNSEALLSLSALQNVNDKRIIIFRGIGGREFLRDTLLKRGAKVDYVECYQRLKPQTDTALLYAAWDNNQTMPMVVTSNQSLKNLQTIIDQEHQAHLLAAPLILISKRTADLSAELGFRQAPVIAEAANDDAILSALISTARV